ncbi:hypothetical protein SSP49_167 [Staphylococcus phage SSP49]|nr:hypothetical protein SSP49_167 [Staphylococcus phage SSP49]
MSNLAHILSILYAILVTVGYIPALVGLIKDKNVKGVDSYFWFYIVVTVSISLTSLFVTHAPLFQIISVSINLLLGIICFIIYLFRTTEVSILEMVMFIIVIYIGYSVANYSVEYGQIMATISIIVAYLSQINKFYKTKSTNGTSKYLFLIIGIALACLIISMLITNTTPHVIYTEVANFILIMICYLQASYYEYKGVDNNERLNTKR